MIVKITYDSADKSDLVNITPTQWINNFGATIFNAVLSGPIRLGGFVMEIVNVSEFEKVRCG